MLGGKFIHLAQISAGLIAAGLIVVLALGVTKVGSDLRAERAKTYKYNKKTASPVILQKEALEAWRSLEPGRHLGKPHQEKPQQKQKSGSVDSLGR